LILSCHFELDIPAITTLDRSSPFTKVGEF
jgi:hypothetical protein